MRRLATLVLAAAAAASFAAPSDAAVNPRDCGGDLTVGPCVVRDPHGSYTCMAGYVAGICLGQWAP